MTHIQVTLTEEQKEALEHLARERRIPLSRLIQEGVTDLLRRTRGQTNAEIKQRALHIAGRFRSGLGDLARRHDDYLAGVGQE